MVCYCAKEHATGLTVLEVVVLIDPLKKGTTSWKKKYIFYNKIQCKFTLQFLIISTCFFCLFIVHS